MITTEIGAPRHDPGGKVSLPLLEGWKGDAWFSPDNVYRHFLSRFSEEDDRFMLWIGMNPSTAAGDVDDPTIRRELGFTIREGYKVYIKCNVMDYRATSPKSLLAKEVTPSTPENITIIDKVSKRADKIVLCFGKLPKKLHEHGQRVVDLLGTNEEIRKKTFCLGKNLDGSPKHPLYLKADTKFIPYF